MENKNKNEHKLINFGPDSHYLRNIEPKFELDMMF